MEGLACVLHQETEEKDISLTSVGRQLAIRGDVIQLEPCLDNCRVWGQMPVEILPSVHVTVQERPFPDCFSTAGDLERPFRSWDPQILYKSEL